MVQRQMQSGAGDSLNLIIKNEIIDSPSKPSRHYEVLLENPESKDGRSVNLDEVLDDSDEIEKALEKALEDDEDILEEVVDI